MSAFLGINSGNNNRRPSGFFLNSAAMPSYNRGLSYPPTGLHSFKEVNREVSELNCNVCLRQTMKWHYDNTFIRNVFFHMSSHVWVDWLLYNRAKVYIDQNFHKVVVRVINIDQWNQTALLYESQDIYSRASLVTVTSECRVQRDICKTRTGTLTNICGVWSKSALFA